MEISCSLFVFHTRGQAVYRVFYRHDSGSLSDGVAVWIYGRGCMGIGFFSIGFIFGEQWQYILNVVEHYLKVIFICLASSFVVLLVWSRIKREKAKKLAKVTRNE